MTQTYKCPQCDYEVQLTAHEAAQVGTPICSEHGCECNPIDTQQLTELAISLGISDDDLDDLVHDAKSNEASAINNQGVAEQIDYLVEAIGIADLEKRIRELANVG